jgi:hypothetical protein
MRSVMFLKEINPEHIVTQNSVGEEEMLVILMLGEKCSGTPFRIAFF